MRVLDKPPKSEDRSQKSEARSKKTEIPPTSDPRPPTSESLAPYKLYNIGNGNPVNLMDFIEVIEKSLGKKAQKNFLPLQKGDVVSTWADTTALEKDTGYKPDTSIKEGVNKFVDWYLEYYNV